MLSFRVRRRNQEAAEKLYASVVVAARRPALYADFGVPDTFQGRFEMIALHLFALIHRLMHDPADDPDLARSVSERFVEDMDGAFREMGVGDLTVPKRMTALYRSFGGRISAYKAALEAGPDALRAAVARNVFPDEPEDWRAGALAGHLMQSLAAIRAVPLADIRHGAIRLPDPATLPAAEAAP